MRVAHTHMCAEVFDQTHTRTFSRSISVLRSYRETNQKPHSTRTVALVQQSDGWRTQSRADATAAAATRNNTILRRVNQVHYQYLNPNVISYYICYYTHCARCLRETLKLKLKLAAESESGIGALAVCGKSTHIRSRPSRVKCMLFVFNKTDVTELNRSRGWLFAIWWQMCADHTWTDFCHLMVASDVCVCVWKCFNWHQ